MGLSAFKTATVINYLLIDERNTEAYGYTIQELHVALVSQSSSLLINGP